MIDAKGSDLLAYYTLVERRRGKHIEWCPYCQSGHIAAGRRAHLRTAKHRRNVAQLSLGL